MIFRLILLTIPFAFSGCIGFLMPVSNAMSVYDIYSVSRDQRDLYSITKDKFLQSKIRSKILFTDGLSVSDIEVESFYANIYLIGLVKDEVMLNRLVALTKDTDGVEKIYTYIKIKQKDYPCNSFNILSNLKRNLFTDNLVEGTNVRVGVVGCDVVFSGVIDSIEQEKHAIWYAKHIDGVQNVHSFMKVVK